MKKTEVVNNRLPKHLKKRLTLSGANEKVKDVLKKYSLYTVCQSAICPNLCECFSKGTATFMIMGNVCTRNCSFCAVKTGTPQSLNLDEPMNLARASVELQLKHIVITSVTRDDLSDGGAEHFAQCISEIRAQMPNVIIEVLTPDFLGSLEALEIVITAKPDIFNHNVEIVPRLYPQVRPAANYERSLAVLHNAKNIDNSIYTKSGLMVGLGEREDEVISVMQDLRAADCDFVTIGQYLAPSKNHYPVVEYIQPEQFARYKIIAQEMGFQYAASDVFVRSSYQAEEFFNFAEKLI